MRELILTLGIPLALIWGLSGPGRAVLVLAWVCFQRPQDFSYGVWNSLPTFFVALLLLGVVAFVCVVLCFWLTPVLAVKLLLLGRITLRAAFEFNTTHARNFYHIYVPSMLAMPIILAGTIHDIQLLKKVIWVATGSIAVTACKAGISLTLAGGAHVKDQISGFVGDNNVFGLVVCIVIAILMGLRSTVPDKRWARVLFFIVICANVMVVVYSMSRGALLTLFVIALLVCMTSGRPVRSVTVLVLLVVTAYLLIPSQYFERLSTLKDVSADVSAMGRLENWGLSWEEAIRFPVLGVGPDNHILYNAAAGATVTLRVAHSVYFQALGELGFPGLFLYLSFLLVSIVCAIVTWRRMIAHAARRPDLAWVRDVAYWMAVAFIAYCFGADFLNMLYIEFPWVIMLLASLLWPLARAELTQSAVKEDVATQSPPRRVRMAYDTRRRHLVR